MQYNVRTVIKDEKIWFCGKDVADALGYAIPSKAINTHLIKKIIVIITFIIYFL